MKRCLLLYLGCMLLLGHVSYGQDFAVSGKVTDDNGEAILGASVLLKGTNIGTITDAAGIYKLNAPDGNGILVFSYIGFETSEIAIAGRSVIDLSMTPALTELGEVVVVGYGTQKKVNLTGSVVSVTGKEIANQPVMQTSNALIGKMPGVTVIQDSGQPGSDAADIRIRGIGTLGNSDPLVLIDGVPGNMNGVDPREIADISVLKDAASASIYGSRAANGVILITTKRGQSGKLKVNYNAYAGWQKPTDLPEFLEGYEYMEHYNQAVQNIGQAPAFTQEYMEAWRENHTTDPDQYPNTDWVNEVFTENGFQQHHSLQLSGGTEMAKVMASLTFMDQNGNIANYNYKRYNARINTDLKVSDKISFNLDFNLRRGIRKAPSAGLTYALREAFRIPPVYASKFSNGNWGPGWAGQNVVASVNAGGLAEDHFNYVRAIMRASYKPLPGMEFSLMYSPQYSDDLENSFRKQYAYYNYGDETPAGYFPSRSLLEQRNNRTLNNNLNAIGTYEKTFGDHFLKALLGYELITNNYRWFRASRDNFPLQDYPEMGAGSSDNMQNDGSANEWGLQSYFARVNYDFKGKYLLEANVRRDGSSRFADGQRYGTFPAFSAGWRISEEPFFGSSGLISDLKLKASWGQLGNQNVVNNNGDPIYYPFASTIALGQNYVFGGGPINGGAQTAMANKVISWETTETTNFGIDLGMFQNRFTLSAEYYIRNTSDILLQLPIPMTIGLNAPYQNAGKVQNKGWDLALGWADEINDFGYGVNFNISDVRNEVIDLRGTGPHIDGASVTKEGYPISSIFGYKSDGLFQSQAEIDNAPTHIGAVAPGDIRYVNQITVDTNEDGVPDAADGLINADDRVIIGDPFPRLMYAMNLTADFKGFDFSVTFQGVGKRDVLATGDAIWAFQNAGKIQEWHTDYWTPENPDAAYPRLVATTSHNNFQINDWWVFDASYLRMRNVTFGYTFPSAAMESLRISNLRLYFSGQNLLTIDNMPKGWDPQIPNATVGALYPITAIYSLGIDLTF